ncbi:hypothetical protein ACHQM5_030616 [Ranunculus cassubicifolius]
MKSSSPKSSPLLIHNNIHPKPLLRTTPSSLTPKRIPAKKLQGTTEEPHFPSTIHMLSEMKSPYVAKKLFLEMKSLGFQPCCDTLSALMLCYAENGLISDAQHVFDQIIYSECMLSMEVVSRLMDAYCGMRQFDEVIKVLHAVVGRDSSMMTRVYSLAIACFGKAGEIEMMESTLEEMISSGLTVDSATGNALIKYYSVFGSLTDMEVAYGRLRRSRILVEEEGIRVVASAYVKEKQFYRLGEFVRSVGLGRKKDGNLLWNLLLLSYAANFKMKSLQREFLRMVDAGFSPDLTTFNIRAVSFSKMSLFWDLHVSLEHMKHENVNPDLVTYGCVVDTFLDRKLGKNLNFALNKLNTDDSPLLLTDSLVFEVFGKGDFHSSSEAFLEYKMPRTWTYRELIKVYLKKKYRSDQIFWNY